MEAEVRILEPVALSRCRSIDAIFQFPPFELSCSDLFAFICHSVPFRSDRKAAQYASTAIVGI